jgi:adenylate cyclase
MVRAMQIEVSPYNVVVRPTLRNNEAYTLYLQGQHAADRYDQQGFEQALIDYQRALDLDPSLVAAADEIARTYALLGGSGFMPPAVAFEQARHFAEHALKLDPNRAITHARLGHIHLVYDWDWAAADRELKLARTLAPNDARILYLAAYQSLMMGRWDDALKQLNASLDLDPLNPGCYYVLSLVQIRRGRLAEAEAAMRRALEISPTFNWAHFYLGYVLLARNEPQAALAEILKEQIDEARLIGSAIAYFTLRRKADSDTALAQMLKSQATHPFSIAEVYAFRGELDEAFIWLDRAYAQKDALLFIVKITPLFKNLEGDPRYKAFLRKMNLPE